MFKCIFHLSLASKPASQSKLTPLVISGKHPDVSSWPMCVCNARGAKQNGNGQVDPGLTLPKRKRLGRHSEQLPVCGLCGGGTGLSATGS